MIDAIEDLDSELKVKKSSFQTSDESQDESSDESQDENPDESQDESSDEIVDSKGLVEVLNFARSVITDASKVDDLDQAREALNYVSGHLNGLEDEMKNKFEEVTELLFKELNDRQTGFEGGESEDESTDEEVIVQEEASNVNAQVAYDSVDVDSGVEVTEEYLWDAVKYARSVIHNAVSEDELLPGEKELIFLRAHLPDVNLQAQSKMIDAIEDLDSELKVKKSSFQTSDESQDENTDEEVIAEELIDALTYVQSVAEGADNDGDLLEAEEVLDFVRANLNKFEGEVKNKFEEATELLGEKLNNRKNFEEGKVAGLMSKLGFSDEVIEDYLNEEEEKH